MEQVLDTVASTPAILPLERQIEAVRDFRAKLAQEKTILDTSREEWYAQNSEQIIYVEHIKHELELSEAALREATLSAYEETGNKKPAPGVGIREAKKVIYEKPDALAWAKDHGVCLDLDHKAFEALAKSCDGRDMPCEVKVEAQATIAREL